MKRTKVTECKRSFWGAAPGDEAQDSALMWRSFILFATRPIFSSLCFFPFPVKVMTTKGLIKFWAFYFFLSVDLDKSPAQCSTCVP